MTNPIQPDSQKIRILYVDDEQDNLVGFKYMFRKDYDLSLAQSANEAIQILDAKKFDIIISDQRMPDQSGVELFEQIHKTHPDTMRMILTGYSDLDVVVDSINKGRIYYFFKKPWDETEVRLVIAHAYDALTLRRQLKMREQRFHDIATSMGGWIWELDAEGRYTFASERVKNILGYKPEELLGKKPEDFVLPEKQHFFHETFSSLISKQQKINDLERWCLCKTGENILVSSDGVPFHNNGDPSGTRGVDTDITAKYNLEQQLRQSQKMEAVGNLAGGIAHDFNNLLQAILSSSELALIEIDSNHNLYDNLTEIKKTALRAADLTKKILTFSRQQDVEIHNIDLNDFIIDSMVMLKRVLPDNIEIQLDLASDVETVRADPTMMTQVLMNLLINASQAMISGGEIKLKTRHLTADKSFVKTNTWAKPESQYAWISVADSGTGIAPDILHKIFEPFFTTKEVGQGTGMGLSVVYGIIQQQLGHIDVSSTLGEGACFNIYLPTNGNIPEAADSYSTKSTPEGSETILVAEDEDIIREGTKKTLESAGYTVMLAQNGTEAIEVLTQHHADIKLALLDMIMPEMDGSLVANQILEQWADIKIIFLAGYMSESKKPCLKTDESITLLTKPCSATKLLKTIRNTLDAKSPN